MGPVSVTAKVARAAGPGQVAVQVEAQGPAAALDPVDPGPAEVVRADLERAATADLDLEEAGPAVTADQVRAVGLDLDPGQVGTAVALGRVARAIRGLAGRT